MTAEMPLGKNPLPREVPMGARCFAGLRWYATKLSFYCESFLWVESWFDSLLVPLTVSLLTTPGRMLDAEGLR